MAKDINLLPDITLQEEKQERTRKLLTLISMSILVLGMVGVVVVFAIQITMQRQYNTLVETNNQLIKDIELYATLENSQRDLVSRISAIDLIRKNAKNFEYVLTKIIELSPSEISYTTLSITNDNVLTMTGSTNSAENLNLYVGKLIEEQDKEGAFLEDISITSLSKTEANNYQFTITTLVTPKQQEDI
jgi:Tfp pilus assembly protein PilN